MSTSRAVTTEATGTLAAVKATFDYSPSKRLLKVAYRIDNASDEAVAVFDRGDRHAVLSRQHAAGAVPAPFFAVDEEGGVTLSHEALPLPTPAPTSPPTPLAAKLAPGASVEGSFEFALPVSLEGDRLRWCVGVAPFTDDDFSAGEKVDGVDLWRASFAVVESQQRVCTAWFDLDRGVFADSTP
ncbi:hypothetical protein [Novilysobacter antarcticus]|uniref:hypothetical protein n=1 Tax=Novilysobacter antarcticus TaxID=2862543 RepID=UPI001C992674|nr:hypothetical protein [Lysobacter antarcticus]